VDLYAYACVRACVRVYVHRAGTIDRPGEQEDGVREGEERGGEMQRETTNRRVEVADAIRRQCWRIAASSSGHNEPIRLYFYFRHASYRAIPSLEPRRLPRRRCAPRICIYTRAHTLADTRTCTRNNERGIAAEHEERHGMAWRDAPPPRKTRPRHGRRFFAGPSQAQRCPRGPLTLTPTPTLPLLPFALV